MKCEQQKLNYTQRAFLSCGKCMPCLQAENERLRKAAVHFEQKAAALQGIIDRIKSNFKAALEDKK